MAFKKIKIIIFLFTLLMPLYRVSADSGGYIVKFNTDVSAMLDKAYFTEISNDKNIYGFYNPNDLKGLEDYIEYSTANDAVELIEGTGTTDLLNLPSDELYPEQWQAQMINADFAWGLEAYGNGIRIGVIDSGCYAHKDLSSNLFAGWNYLDNSPDTSDNNGHGTHVSGIIAAEMNGFGTVGISPKSKIIPLKCFDPSSDTYVDTLIKAIYDAVDIYKCRIINMSWGLKSDNECLEDAINYAYDKGVILVAAVGNKGTETLYYPGAYENVIGVGSVGISKKKSAFSQHNKSVMVVAPGEKVRSTYKNDTYEFMQGTSQAAPYVSATAANVLSANENITNREFEWLLIETADDLGENGYDTLYGYGLINGENLLNRALLDVRYYVSPINTDGSQAYVLIKNNTDDILTAESIFSSYNNGLFEHCTVKEITLLPGKAVKTTMQDTNTLSHFLWSGVESMIPLADKREVCK